ncbi:MAG: response regulator [Planctomycetota bacterium]|nr:response regulator [Planctomycetota bacterium]
MKAYPANLFSPWPGDATPERAPTSPRAVSLFAGFHADADVTIKWLLDTMQTLGQEQDDEVFERVYRRCHVVSGFAQILEVPKISHLWAMLDFALDFVRKIETFQQHSLDYVVKMLLETSRTILDDLSSKGTNGLDLTDIVSECKMYLQTPLDEWTAELEKPPEPEADLKLSLEAPTEAATEAVAGPGAAEAKPAAKKSSIDLSTIDDGPEIIDVAPDKVSLVNDFCEESRDNLDKIGNQLIELEETDEPIPLVNDLFRSVHTVKGGSRLLKFMKMETLTHHLESLLNDVRNGERKVTPEMIDVLLAGKTLLDAMVDEVASSGPIKTKIMPVMEALVALDSGEAAPAKAAPSAAPPESQAAEPKAAPAVEHHDHPEQHEHPEESATKDEKSAGKKSASKRKAAPQEMIRVPTTKLDDVLNNASEVFITRIRLQSDVIDMGNALQHCGQTMHRIETLGAPAILGRLEDANQRLLEDLARIINRTSGKVDAHRLTPMVTRFQNELSDELNQDNGGISPFEELNLNLMAVEETRKRVERNVEQLEQLSARVQSGAMSFRMVPVSQLFDRFPTQVRDMGRQVGKRVKLEISGADTELDKVLINQLGDPLMHMLRNSVDHGLETPEEREAAGKNGTGLIKLSAFYHGSHVVIEIVDDGRGIDPAVILPKAIKKNLVDLDEAASLTKSEILNLIFEPGFSTKDAVSTLSGRGVGMDVVKTAVNQVQGSVVLESDKGVGTRVTMKLPLTLAVVGIVLVEEGPNRFAFPILNVEEIVTIDKADLGRISENTLYDFRGKTIPVNTLSGILNFQPSLFSNEEVLLVVLTDGERQKGIIVDSVPGRQEVLIKNLGDVIKSVPFIMGCTILSDSRLVLILNAWEIVNLKDTKRLTLADGDRKEEQRPRKSKRVLVIDDSPIQRRNLESILRQAGFRVDSAENGFDAIKRVEQQRYSAFCVDIIMPLMDGFEFVERLKKMPLYDHLPAIFVTGREGEEEKRRSEQLGMRGLLTKPVDSERLIRIMDEICGIAKVEEDAEVVEEALV